MKDWSWVRSVPVVRINELTRRSKTNAYARLSAHRLVKTGILKRVTRGIYTSSDDVFAVASNLHHPSYISFLSASYRHGFTEAIPRRIYVASASRHKEFEFDGYAIEFVQSPHMWGYHKEGEGPSLAFVADVEKLMIDAFLRPKCMGNFAEIENIFRNAGKTDGGRLAEYLKRCGSERISRQVGWMAERHLGMDLSGLWPPGRNYHALNPFKKGKEVDRKWRLWI